MSNLLQWIYTSVSFIINILYHSWKQIIEYIIDECVDAGIKEIIFIISKKKEIIKKYFYNDTFYKNLIKKKNDPRIIKEYKKRRYEASLFPEVNDILNKFQKL